MATIDQLRDRFKLLTHVKDDEIDNEQLEFFLSSSIVEHNSAYEVDGSDLPEPEVPLVMLLAQIQLCVFRANSWANQPSTSGGQGYGSDRDTPFNKNMSLAKYLRDEYDNKSSAMGIMQDATMGSGDITLGVLTRVDENYAIRTPLRNDPTALAPVKLVSLNAAASTSADLRWNASADEVFYSYVLFYRAGTADLYVETNFNSATGIPKVADDAIKLFEKNNATVNSVKVTGLTANTAYRFMLVVLNANAKAVYSNTLDITTAA